MSHSTFRRALSPLLSIALLMLGNGFFTTFVSVRLYLDGHSALIVGLVQSAFYAGYLLGALKIEALMHRIRHIRAYAFFTCIATAILLMQGLLVHPIIWIFERFVMGLCIASLYVVIESWLLIISPQSTRGKLLGFYMLSLYGAQSLSQFFMDFLDLNTLSPFVVAATLSSLSMIPVTFTYTQVPDQGETERSGFFSILKRSPFGAGGCVISGLILSAIYSFLPNFAEKSNLSVSSIMSVTIAGGFLLQWPLGHLSDIFDRRKILLLVSALTIVPCIAIMILKLEIAYIIGPVFFLGGMTFTLYPLSITHVTDRHLSEDLTSITAVLLFAYSFGSVLGPLIAPFFIKFFQPHGLFIYIGAMGGLLTLTGLLSTIFSKPVPREDQNDFVPLTGSPLSYELDPRSNEENSEQSNSGSNNNS